MKHRFGRLHTFIGAQLFLLSWWAIAVWAPWYSVYGIARFMTGAGKNGAYIAGYVYSEYIVFMLMG